VYAFPLLCLANEMRQLSFTNKKLVQERESETERERERERAFPGFVSQIRCLSVLCHPFVGAARLGVGASFLLPPPCLRPRLSAC
jgi:hypothetical protein